MRNNLYQYANNSWFNLAEGYSISSRDYFRNKQKQELLELLGNPVIIETAYFENFDGDRETSITKTNVEELIEDCQCSRWFKFYCLEKVNNLESFLSVCQDLLENHESLRFETEEENKQRLSEEERQQLEQFIANFAAVNKVKPGSLEFLQIIDESIEQNRQHYEYHNGYEAKAEHWADCSYAGSNSYFDDIDYTNSCLSSELDLLSRARNWIQDNCPLLWCKYQENKNESISA